MNDQPKFIAIDMSSQVFGRYQTCFHFEGHWYSDQDEDWRSFRATPKPGSVARDGFVYQPALTVEDGR